MLQQIRDRATGPLAWFIVGIICVPFAFFGIEAFNSSGGSSNVAKVGGTEISDNQLQFQYDQRYQQLQQMLGESFRADLINPDMLRRSVLDGLIQDEVNRQYLSRTNYRIADQDVLGFIRAQEAFQEDGVFSPSLYRQNLSRQGMSAVQYEDRVRAYLSDQQLRNGITGSALITEAELEQAYALDKQKRSFTHRLYKASAVAGEISIEDAAIEARYEARKAALQAPERVRVAYVELDRDVLKQTISPDETALRELYEAEKESRFRTAEQRKARHILIRNSNADARAQIENLAAQLAEGADFSELAQAHSEDPGSKAKGGDLGWVSRGMMVEPFEEALFGLKVNSVSAPVETSFGWHLIRLDEKRDARIRPFEEASTQEELVDLYREREAAKQFTQKAEKLEQLSFENPASLQPVVDGLGLELKKSAWFTREGGAGIAADEAVVAAAYSPLVLNDGENSQPLTVGRRQLVLRLLEHEPARQQTLDEVKDELRAELRAEAIRAKLQERVEADLARLNAGEITLKDLDDSELGKTAASLTVERGDNQPHRQIVAAVFDLAAPAADARSYHSMSYPGSQDLVVLELSKVAPGDWAQATESEKQSLRARVLTQRSNLEFAALQNALKAQASIKVFRDSF